MGGTQSVGVVATRPQLTKSELTHPSVWVWPLLAIVAIGMASATMATSYDEMYWLAVIRELSAGGQLYDTVLDNKGPLWYPIYTLLDAIPLAFNLVRGLMLAGVGAVVTTSSRFLLRKHGVSERHSKILATVIFLSAALSSLLHLTVEIVVAMLVLGIMVFGRHRIWVAALCFGSAILIDPRVVLLSFGLITYIRQSQAGPPPEDESNARRLLPVLILGGVSLTLYAVHPDLRFALTELSLESRPLGLPPISFYLGVLGAVGMPLVISFWTVARPSGLRLPRAGWLFGAGAVLIAAVSVAPLTHYWTYLPLTLAMLTPAPRVRSPLSQLWIAFTVVAMIPLLVLTLVVDGLNRESTERYKGAIDQLSSSLGETGKVVILSFAPHAIARFPEQSLNQTPVPLGSLLATSRQARHLEELSDQIERAETVWIEAAPGTEPADEDTRLWQLVSGQLSHLPCQRVVAPFVVREPPASDGNCRFDAVLLAQSMASVEDPTSR